MAALLSALLASAIGVWVLQLWNASLSVPFVLDGDVTTNLMIIKDTLTHGWFLTNPDLGAPFGQELYDFPAYNGDSFYLLIIKLLGVPFGNPALVMNLFYLSGFPLIAITGFAVMRKLGIAIGVAIVCSVLYAALPYHFLRNEYHIFLGTYFMVPVCCYLVFALLMGDELFGRNRRARGPRAYLTWRTAGVVGLCLVVGSSDNYFAAFTVALMTGAAILRFLATRRIRVFICGLVASSIVFGAIALNGLPTLIYTAEHGKNVAVGQRHPAETELYSLTLANLVLPIENHRIPALASLAKEYQSTTVAPQGESAEANLGIVGTLGLLGLAIALCLRGLRGPRSPRNPRDPPGNAEDQRPVYAAVGAGMAFIIGTVGGLATLFAFIVSPDLRAPNRISIFIGFFAIFGVALGLDRLYRRWAGGRWGRVGIAIVLAAVLVVGTLDQTSPQMAADYGPEIAQYRSDGAFVHEIETEVPHNAEIFEIPVVSFPESGPTYRAAQYDDLIGYLHSVHLRWTAGAMMGRPTDWTTTASTLPTATLLEQISAAGFSGVYVDTFALTDGGSALLPELESILGAPPLTSSDGRLYFFNMDRYNQQLRARRSAIQLTQLARTALHPEG